MYIEAPFYNGTRKDMDFDNVVSHVKEFINKDPRAAYRLSIGTDSHVHRDYTRFITAIHLHRIGKGAWGCLREYNEKRRITSLKEKISKETSLSQEVAYRFAMGPIEDLAELIGPYEDEGGSLEFEVHLDIGKKGLTRHLIGEMTNRIDAMGIGVRIKPDSYAASSYAHRETK